MERKIRIPHNFVPRDYQVPLFNCLNRGYRRAIAVWHRRSGKDKTLINIVAKESQKRVGSYFYYFPTFAQAKKVIWDGMDRAGFRFLDHFPKQIVARKNDSECKIRFKNGSLFQLIGTDRLDVVGTNPVGAVFSEYSLQNPLAFQYVLPILIENDGWAIFNFTPRGMNHAYDLLQRAKMDPAWFTEILTVDDTGAMTPEQIREEISTVGMSEELVQQEFWCSFEGGLEGAYYIRQINKAYRDGRIRDLPLAPMPVCTFWDIGRADATAIWFAQFDGTSVRVIDYYENNNKEFDFYVKILNGQDPADLEDKTRLTHRVDYTYGIHYFPHDAEQERINGPSLFYDIQHKYKLKARVVPRTPTVQQGIEFARQILPLCYFDQRNTQKGINTLSNYKKIYDDKRQCFRDEPEHDWASHCADAFRYMAVAYKQWGGDIAGTDQAVVKPFVPRRPPSAMAA